jgi:hypothetical protein
MKIDRRFKMIRKKRLLSMGQKIIRNGQKVDFLTYPPDIFASLKDCIARMEALYASPLLRSTIEIQDQIRDEEAELKKIFNQLADYCDTLNLSRYDVNLLGFASKYPKDEPDDDSPKEKYT